MTDSVDFTTPLAGDERPMTDYEFVPADAGVAKALDDAERMAKDADAKFCAAFGGDGETSAYWLTNAIAEIRAALARAVPTGGAEPPSGEVRHDLLARAMTRELDARHGPESRALPPSSGAEAGEERREARPTLDMDEVSVVWVRQWGCAVCGGAHDLSEPQCPSLPKPSPALAAPASRGEPPQAVAGTAIALIEMVRSALENWQSGSFKPYRGLEDDVVRQIAQLKEVLTILYAHPAPPPVSEARDQ